MPTKKQVRGGPPQEVTDKFEARLEVYGKALEDAWLNTPALWEDGGGKDILNIPVQTIEKGVELEPERVIGTRKTRSVSTKEAKAAPELTRDLAKVAKRVNYRKIAFAHYEQLGQVVCAHCGFGIRDVLEVAHLDRDRSHNEVGNLAILCPNCHKMYDLDLITYETIVLMRDRPKIVVWAKRMKDAGAKAAETRRLSNAKHKRQEAGRKAAATRKTRSAPAATPR